MDFSLLYSPEAESSLLGCLLIDATRFDEISEIVSANDFFEEKHRRIWQAINDLLADGKSVDVVTVGELLERRKEDLLIGGLVYLYDIANSVPGISNMRYYAEIIRERALLRKMALLAQQIQESVFTPASKNKGSAQKILDEFQEKLFRLSETAETGKRSTLIEIKDALKSAVQTIQNVYDRESEGLDDIVGLPSGLTELDQLTSGLQKSDLIILAARPSMGKSALALNITEHVALVQKLPVLFFSMEMSAESLAVRLISSNARVAMQKLRTGRLTENDWHALGSSLSHLYQAPIIIDESGVLTPTEVRARARRVMAKYGQLGLIVIDYLQLMSSGSNGMMQRVAEISEITRSLKKLAKELDVPILTLSQLNRNLEQRPNKRPLLSDLRESGAIEQDADIILFLYRDEVYNPDSADKGTAELIVAKHRNGPTGMVRLQFDGQFTRFGNGEFASVVE